MSGVTVERMAFVVAMLVKKPRTAQEFSELLGCKPDAVRVYLRALEDEFLIQRQAKGVYRWLA